MSKNFEQNERNIAPVFEISSETQIVGRRPIKAVLHEIFPDDKHYQENGVSWNEKYTELNLNSVVGMSIVAEFIDDDKEIPYGHGMTGIREEDDLPIFENATMVGHFDKAYIDDVIIDDTQKRVLIAEGTLDEMRYPNFVKWLHDRMVDSTVRGSVEIVGKSENGGRIVYEDGWKEYGRVPVSYDYSGFAILTVAPADESSIIMELNNNKNKNKGDERMDEKMLELKNDIVKSVTDVVNETNNKFDEYWAKMELKEAEIAQLQAQIEQLKADIAKLSADFETEKARADAAEAGLEEANATLKTANEKIVELENAAAVAELDAALKPYSEEQRKVAEEEIKAFNENPGSVEINAIIGKICTEMVRLAREDKTNEQNSSDKYIDVFGLTEDVVNKGEKEEEEEDVDVF